MVWVQLLGAVALIVLVAALFRAKPDDTRTIRNTRLMTVGKVFLVAIALILVLAYFAPAAR